MSIFIVLASWVFYRYVAPKHWREWAGAGLVQAFIVALYAEMFGFPLTLYLLVRVFKLDASRIHSTNLWSNIFGAGAMVMAMAIGWIFVLAGILLVAEGWREVYYARGQNRLAQEGLYGLIRHPQYTGIFLALFGEGIVHWPTLFSVTLFPVIVTAYVLLARKEEKELAERFGAEYREYQGRVPAFLPRWKNLKEFLRRPLVMEDKLQG